MTDSLAIKDKLKSEIDSALRAMETFDAAEFKKEVLEAK